MIQARGQIFDVQTGETLPGANVYLSDKTGAISSTNTGTMSDNNGKYQLQGDGAYITASYVGYSKATKPISSMVNFYLDSDNTLQEVEVIADKIKPTTPKNYTLAIVAGIAIIGIGTLLYFIFYNP